ncbi:hypothetical protein [Streptomyces sp. NPDC047108]|uniref:hypothetical protein n=1 Tax=Streptomyces sp. NPDC047108 TaxID=3155025 RepID=UPI0033C3DAF6
MKIPSRGSFAAFALCATAAAAVTATPAFAAGQPGGTTWDRTGSNAQDDLLGQTVESLAPGQDAAGRPSPVSGPAPADQGGAVDPAAVDQGHVAGTARTPAPPQAAKAPAHAAPAQTAPAQAQAAPAPAGPVQTLMGLGMPDQGRMAQNPMPQADFGTAREPRVPLMAPLGTMESSLPVDAPELGGSVPAMPVRQPSAREMTPEMTKDGVAPRATIPSLSTQGAPTAFLEAPVPTLQDGGGRSAARLEAPNAPVRTTSPRTSLDLPIQAPRDGRQGLPELKAPDADLTPPSAHGDPGAGLGLTQRNEPQRLPLATVTRTATGVMPDAGQTLGNAAQRR